MKNGETNEPEGYGGGQSRYEQLASELKPDECLIIGPSGLFEKYKVSFALLRMSERKIEENHSCGDEVAF